MSKRPVGLGRMLDEDELEKMYAGRNQPAPSPPAPVVVPAPEVTVNVPEQSPPDVNVRVDTAAVAAAIKAGFDQIGGKKARLVGITCDNVVRGMGGGITSFQLSCHWSDE